MPEKKSILEEALLDIKNIQSALNANTKEILRSVAREEIDSVVKESLLREDDYEEDLESTDDADGVDLGGDADAASAGIETGGELGDEEDLDGDLDDIEGSEEVGSEVPAIGGNMKPEIGMDADALDGDEMDMTASSDDDVIAIYKKLSGEDEIEIVDDEIHFRVSGPGEYIVKATDLAMGGGKEPKDLVTIDGDEDGGIDYEIEMGDEEGSSEEPADLTPVDGDEEDSEDDEESSEEEEELTENIPVGSAQAHRLPGKSLKGLPLGAGADNLKESKAAKQLVFETAKKYNTLLTEAKKLKTENEEFRKALGQFRHKLVETVVFNSNLTYVTRLFMEHATTKGEKQSIISRFDAEVTSLKESKKLYKAIGSELANRKPINESIESKIIKEVNSSSSKQLNESTAYVDPSTKRILDLINRVERK